MLYQEHLEADAGSSNHLQALGKPCEYVGDMIPVVPAS